MFKIGNKKTNEIDKSTYRHVLKYTGVFGGVQGLYIVMAVIRNKFTAILIGAAGMGMADLFNRTAEFIGNSTNFGLSFSAIRRISELYEKDDAALLHNQIKLVRSWGIITALLGLVVGIVLAPLLSYLSFGNLQYTAQFLLLAPLAPLLTLSGCELAILKGIRQLKRIAFATSIAAISTLLITIPIYWLMGIDGVVLVLLLTTLATYIINVLTASKVVPWQISLHSWQYLKQGSAMIKLGIAYIGAGMITSGAETAVRFFLNRVGTLHEVGLYVAGLTLTVSYARIVFVAMDADYFPRLSGVNTDLKKSNHYVNRQIDVCVWLMTPLLIAFSLLLPIIVRLLYTSDFLPIVPMVLLALPCMYFKAITSPIAYLALAHGDSKVFLIMEILYDIFFVALVILGYLKWSLIGAGAALTLAYLLDLIMISAVYRLRYGFRFDGITLRFAFLHFIFLLMGVCCIWQQSLEWKYIGGGSALLASCALSGYLFLKIHKK